MLLNAKEVNKVDEFLFNFSRAAAFGALRNWCTVQGLAIICLGLVALSHCLTAELSLMPIVRSDNVLERAALSDVAMRARERDRRANLGLTGISAARPAAELHSLIDGLWPRLATSVDPFQFWVQIAEAAVVQ